MKWHARWIPADRWLLAIVATGLVLAVLGNWWGWVESWHPDQMALLPLVGHGRLPLAPEFFLKPPFHTYLNFFLSVLPVNGLERAAGYITGQDHDWRVAVIYVSRIIQVVLFVGIFCLSYSTVKQTSGPSSARITALLIATSAGFVLQAHFLTVDVPVTFWMILGFWCAQRIFDQPTLGRYAIAGFVVGIATATKYNALAVGLAIPIFHIAANCRAPLPRLLVDPRLALGVSMVVVGFVAGNPYSVIEFERFVTDFIYNFVTAPRYYGMDFGDTSFALFPLRIVEVIGLPSTIAMSIAVVAVVSRISLFSAAENTTSAAALGVFVLYFIFFGMAPRLEARFVLPMVPFLLIAGAPAWRTAHARFPRSIVGIALLLGSYGVLASAWVDYRFATDPRMQAAAWVAANVPTGSTMESTRHSPLWNLYPDIDVVDVRIPNVTGRRRLFARTFATDPRVLADLATQEPVADVEWFSASSLARRSPEFIALSSHYTERFSAGNWAASLYPEIATHLRQLLDGRIGYEVVFSRRSLESPAWLYPRTIDHVDGEFIILRRIESR